MIVQLMMMAMAMAVKGKGSEEGTTTEACKNM